MKKIIYTIIFFTSLLFIACVEDDTVISFKELNEVDITNLEIKYSVMLYDNLTVTPTIETTFNDDSNLTYLWYLRQTSAAKGKDTLSREKTLNMPMLPKLVTPGIPYTLIFKVTDDATGVYYRKEMALEIMTLFTKGTLLLCKDEGNAEVNFLRVNEERTLFENVYATANDGQIVGTNPLKIWFVNPNEHATYMKKVIIACSDENGGMYTSPVSLKADKTFKDGFQNSIDESPIIPSLYAHNGIIEYVVTNGKLYKRATNMGAENWEAPLVCMDGNSEYEIAPHIMDLSSSTFYDRLNNRLLQHSPWNKGALRHMPSEGADKSQFDPNNIGKNMELVCSGKESENGIHWMLMKNTENKKLYILRFKMEFVQTGSYSWQGYEKFISKAKIEINSSVAPNIYNAISFSANSEVNDICMYSTSDKIYSFRVGSLTSVSNENIEAIQVDLATENMEITNMEFTSIIVPEPTEEDPLATRLSNQLRIFVLDNNLPAKRGGVVFYEVSSEGGIHSTHIFTRTGFCDEVIDVDEKYS